MQFSWPLTAVACCVALTGCGAADGPGANPALSSTATPPPSGPPHPATAAPTPPRMPRPPRFPRRAAQHTGAGAQAFVEYVIAELNYSQTSLDSSRLRTIFSGACVGCAGVIGEIDRLRIRGGSLEGGIISASNLGVTDLRAEKKQGMQVRLRYAATRQIVRLPRQKPTVYEASAAPLTLVLDEQRSGWLVTSWEAR